MEKAIYTVVLLAMAACGREKDEGPSYDSEVTQVVVKDGPVYPEMDIKLTADTVDDSVVAAIIEGSEPPAACTPDSVNFAGYRSIYLAGLVSGKVYAARVCTIRGDGSYSTGVTKVFTKF